MVFGRKTLLATVAGAMTVVGPASAQFYFRPFFQPFAYSYDYPGDDDGPARYGSRRAVASILAREGFRLVGPLGHRGEQIVATGWSRHDGEMRFIVDPYEGRIIRGTRLGPPGEYDRGPRRDDESEYVRPLGGSRPVVRELDPDDEQPDANPQRRGSASARLREAPEREWVAVEGKKERAGAPRRLTPAAPSPRAGDAAPRRPETEPVEARPPETNPQQAKHEPSATAKSAGDAPSRNAVAKPAAPIAPAQAPATAAPAAVSPAKREPNMTIIAKPSPAASTPATGAPMSKTAGSAGGSSHRAIAPPTTGPAASASTNKSN